MTTLDLQSAATLMMPKFCTVKNLNWFGEVMHGTFDGTYYVLDDGDCYLPETLYSYSDCICSVEFHDNDPRTPSPSAMAGRL